MTEKKEKKKISKLFNINYDYNKRFKINCFFLLFMLHVLDEKLQDLLLL